MSKFIVYRAYNKKGKSYVGYTSKGLKKRISSHMSRFRHMMKTGERDHAIYEAMKYYIFCWELLCETNNKEEALDKEREFIKEYNSKSPNGYNMTDGGEGHEGIVRSEKTRKKMSARMKKAVRDKNSNIYKNLQNQKIKVERSDGKRYSSMSEAAKDVGTDAAWVYNVAIGKNMSCKGYDFEAVNNRHMKKLKKFNREQARKSKEQQKTPIIDNDGIIYESISEASRQLNLPIGNIYKVLKGERRHCGNKGFWFFNQSNEEEEEKEN